MELDLNKEISTADFVTRVENRLEKDKAYKLFVKAESLRINKEFQLSIVEYLKSIFIDRNNPKTLFPIKKSLHKTCANILNLKSFSKGTPWREKQVPLHNKANNQQKMKLCIKYTTINKAELITTQYLSS